MAARGVVSRRVPPSSNNPDGTAVCDAQRTQFDGTPSVADYIPNHNPFQFYNSTSTRTTPRPVPWA
jgi:hypothetical protein